MSLKTLIPDAATLLAMAPERLAVVLLPAIRADMDRNPRRAHFASFTAGVQGDYGAEGAACAVAVAAAWTYLVTIGVLVADPTQNAGWFVLTQRGEAIRGDEDFRHLQAVSLYPRGRIHPYIERLTFADYVAGDYESAVFKAFRGIEIAIRDLGDFTNADFGLVMVAKAFAVDGGRLTMLDDVSAEREAVRNLFMGAYGWFRNPTGHRSVRFDGPEIALEILGLASLMMRQIDAVVDRRREYEG
jgi:uncharacterized protein (TIGR02391 family)